MWTGRGEDILADEKGGSQRDDLSFDEFLLRQAPLIGFSVEAPSLASLPTAHISAEQRDGSGAWQSPVSGVQMCM